MERITILGHVELAEIAPGAAYRVEIAAAQIFDQPGREQRLIDDPAGLFHRAAREIDEPQGANGQGETIANGRIADIDELEAAAAKVAHDTVGVGYAGHHAKRGKLRFLLARQNVDF